MFRCPRPFLVLPLSVAWLGTAPVPAAAAPLTADQCREVVRAVGQSLMDGYVIPETAETMRDALERRLADGDFAGLDDAVLAGELTRILHELSHDLHLKVNVGGAAPPVAVEKRVVGVNGDEEPEEGEPVAVPAGLQQVDAFPEARMLAGNVGYVPVTLFRDLPGDRELAARRMAAVAGADALIFDLRGCMGGFPSMVHFVTSYLYDGEPRHLLTYYHAEGEPDSAYTFEDVPGERLPDADVYILTSSYTASGGEEFTHTLKHHGRATVVGTRTAGAGHGGGVHPLPHGFSMFLPVFRPVHPVTGGGWEDRGVLPDVEVPSSRALEVAHLRALRERLERGVPPRDEAAVRAEVDRLEDATAGSARDADALRVYAARYDIREVSVEGATVFLQRDGGPRLELVPDPGAPDAFTLAILPAARIRFVRDDADRVVALEVLQPGASEWETSWRDGSASAP